MNAMAITNAHGAMFNALLGVLRDNNILSPSKIKLIFLGAAAMVDEMQPADDMQRQAQSHMRLVIVEAAKGHGIEIPAPGETGMQRKH